MRRCAEAYEDAEDSTAQAECEVLLLKALKACRNKEAPGTWRDLAAIANGVFGRTGQSWVKSPDANELERHQERCQADLALYRARDSLDADDSQRAVTYALEAHRLCPDNFEAWAIVSRYGQDLFDCHLYENAMS
jgi:hypothetical protein